MEGGFLYVLFTESKVFCAKVHGSGSTSFEFCGECDDEPGQKPASKSFTSSLTRPKPHLSMPRLSVSKDTKVFAVAYEISHNSRADLKWARSARARAE